jgi:hypothetical protein
MDTVVPGIGRPEFRNPIVGEQHRRLRLGHGQSGILPGQESPPRSSSTSHSSGSAGPPAMVTGLRHILVRAGVDEDDIRTEEFAGY